MEKYKVFIFPAAQNDFDEMIEYINALSPQAAAEHYDAIVEEINKLEELPERFPLARDPQLRLRGYRILPVKNYIVFYVVKENTVEIRRILYARSGYQSNL